MTFYMVCDASFQWGRLWGPCRAENSPFRTFCAARNRRSDQPWTKVPSAKDLFIALAPRSSTLAGQ